MKKKNILVTGGSGFVGINLLKILSKKKEYKIISTYLSSKNFYKVKGVKYVRSNLEVANQCLKITENIDIVIMCAANSSGAAVMEKTPLVHLTPNMRMNLNMLEASHKNNVKKFVFISSNTVYPVSDYSMKENDSNYNFFYKYHTVAWMKKFSEIVCDIYSNKIKSKMQTVIIRPGNLYGPHDKFDPGKAKVVPSLITRVVNRENPIIVWGDGMDLKDFLYIEDFCKILAKIVKSEKKFAIFNIASGNSITIKNILNKLIKIEKIKYCRIKYDKTKPTMIPKRLISINKIKKKYKFKPSTTIETGLKKTLAWYKKNYS
ncbi:NAD-dependent epimerase/dehydratase family protein [Candidatus Pelagibacter sp.]|uniref:NAD-dependent epimerase/dehydratase family protein n=1 Tax=Candidatus Pelagibacter sp. TaxID=2024849 RepID=UPI003F8582CF